ncbi:hypothetical protein [Oryzifoliimicrobium ureilyticus]|uniref:hypothetical protein n=1 Tax=Oryzifoliimicrobium ureilyticus TaxID=3113724 RepID=UPI0030762C41
MVVLRLGVFAVAASLMLSSVGNAQTANVANQTAPAGWNLPAELVSKRLSDDALKAANGNFGNLLKSTPGDAGRIPGLTESFVLTSPTSLPQVVNYAVQSTTNEETAAVGLGLCTTTSSLMNAANNPASPPSQAQAARDLARNILSSIAAASQTSARTNQAISTSFGVSVNANGGVAVTCKALNGEVVATTAVSPAAAGSNAGLGSPVTGGGDPTATVGLNGDQANGGGSQRHISFPSFATALIFAANNISSTTQTVAVPGPEAGAGILPVAGMAYWFAMRRRRASRDVRQA